MPWTNWPSVIPKGKHNFVVTVTGKNNTVLAGVGAAFTNTATKAAKKAAMDEVQRFLRVAHNTPAASRAVAIVIDPPKPYPLRIVRQYNPKTLVLLNVRCRMYLDMVATG